MTSPTETLATALTRVKAVRESTLTIYDPVLPTRPDLLFPDDELEELLWSDLAGLELSGPIRTRSKVAKQVVAAALGYGVPATFKKTKPRFPGQNFDIHVQTNDNLQIWNQEVSPERRYVLIRPDENGIVQAVRVVCGQQVAAWDRTGTLTSKFQAKRISGRSGSALASPQDTARFVEILKPGRVAAGVLASQGPGKRPTPGAVLPIAEVFRLVLELEGSQLPPAGFEEDRVRGELLQAAVTRALGLAAHDNHGQWPDIVSQALEVKLQTSPTIDLGLVLPTDIGPAFALSPALQHCDARYVIAYGIVNSTGGTTIKEIVVATGADFFNEFVQFGGLVTNSKRQIRLPPNLFEP